MCAYTYTHTHLAVVVAAYLQHAPPVNLGRTLVLGTAPPPRPRTRSGQGGNHHASPALQMTHLEDGQAQGERVEQ
jgi:hypothetical protein